MSKNISVKINNGNTTIETVKLNTSAKKVIIKAQPHVNYELVDETTQYAPEMIDTKRVGNDLYIAFEGTDINKESDLVLEGYYEHDNTELVLGMAEDGQYYAYVPQSGVESDAVTLLADQVFAPQALGGNSVTAPFWAFNPNWLWVAAGVAAVGGIIAAASGSHGGGSSNNTADKPSDNSDANNNSNSAKDTTAPSAPQVTPSTTDGSVTVKVPNDAQVGDTVEVTVITETSDTPEKVTLTKNADGSWTSDKPEILPNVDAGKDSSTIPQDKVKDASDVTAVAKDPAGNNSALVTAQAGENVDTTAPAKPTIEAKMNGFVYITPPADEDTKSVEVRYTDEKGNPQTVTITKDADKGWVSSNPNDDIWLNSETGKITLLAHKVKGDSPVNASATDNQGNTGEEATANAVNVTDTYGPSAPDSVSLQDGAIGVILPKYSNVGDSVVIKAGTYAKNRVDNSWGGSNENDFIETVATLTKQQDGSWISDKPENVPHVDAGNNRAIVTADKLKGFEFLNIDATDPSGHSIGFVQGWSDTSYSPEITVKTDGFMKITPPAVQDLKSMEVKYTDEAGTVKFTTLTRGEDGNWTSDNPDVTVEPATGNAMISVDKIQDTSSVYARTITNSDMGSNWSSRMVDKNPDTRPSAPEVIPSTKDGSVTVKVPDDAKVGDIVQVDIFPETKGVFWDSEYYFDMPINMYLVKNADGSWTSTESTVVPPPDSPSPAILPHIPAGQNSTTIPQDRVKDGYEVTAWSRDSAGHQSARVTAQAGKDTGDTEYPEGWAPPDNIGSSGDDVASFKQIAGTLNMGAGNDILEARSTEHPFYLNSFYATVDMGSGDDIVRTSGNIYSDDNPWGDKPISIDGGDDFDTFEFVNRDDKAIMTRISALSNFEKVDITGTLNNTVNIHKEDVERNHNTKATVDDSGKSHNNVLIVDGDEGDKVNLNDISNVASSQVTYEGNTYHVYHTGSNELWVDSDIAVV